VSIEKSAHFVIIIVGVESITVVSPSCFGMSSMTVELHL